MPTKFRRAMVTVLTAGTLFAAGPADAIVRPDRDVYPDEARWVAAILSDVNEDGDGIQSVLFHMCTAVLVQPRVLLTAAHCVYDEPNPSSWVIRIGHHTDDDPRLITRRAAAVVYHGLYERGLYELLDGVEIPLNGGLRGDETDYEGDIAVILLDRALPRSELAHLPRTRAHVPAPGWRTYGWGVTGEAEDIVPDRLLTAAQDDLTADYRLSSGEPFTNVYAASRFEGAVVSGTCWGDSGGPLVDGTGTVIGLTSWADAENCAAQVPTLFTRVASYLDWIDSAVRTASSAAAQARARAKRSGKPLQIPVISHELPRHARLRAI